MKYVRSFFSRPCALMVMLMTVTTVGCGSNIAYVEGTVKQDGKPLDKILVEFWPAGEGPRSMGETDAQGHFVLTTDDGKTQGAVIGNHRVVLKDSAVFGDKFLGRAAENKDISGGRKPRIANSYTSAESSPLSQTVASSNNKFEFDVKAK